MLTLHRCEQPSPFNQLCHWGPSAYRVLTENREPIILSVSCGGSATYILVMIFNGANHTERLSGKSRKHKRCILPRKDKLNTEVPVWIGPLVFTPPSKLSICRRKTPDFLFSNSVLHPTYTVLSKDIQYSSSVLLLLPTIVTLCTVVHRHNYQLSWNEKELDNKKGAPGVQRLWLFKHASWTFIKN